MPDQQNRRLIFSNDLGKVSRLVGDGRRPIRYLVLDPDAHYQHIGTYLAGLDHCEAVDLSEESRRLRPSFKAKYVELMANLNQANHSFSWWGYDFTRKECLYTRFAERIFQCYLISELARQEPQFDILVVTGDSLLASQMSSWATSQGMTSLTALSLGWRLNDRIRSLIVARVVFTVLRAFHYWLMLKVLYRPKVNPKDGYVVVGTLLDEERFIGDGGYRDIFFGELPEFMSHDGTPVMVYGGVLKDVWKILKLMRSKHQDVLVLPWHYFSTLTSILSAAGRWIARYYSPVEVRGNPCIDGVAIDQLIKSAIQSDLRSGHFFESMWVYNSSQDMAKKVNVSSCVIPFENRSWEKMLLAGVASNGHAVRTVGYHHAAVTPAHTHLLLGPDEAEVIPLPDNIIMMGEVTKKILDDSGNYPAQMLKSGCALRQGRDTGQTYQRHRDGPAYNVLVALANSFDEYVSVLSFLEEAFQGAPGYDVRIRPHPEFPFEQALRRLPGLDLNYQLIGGPLEDNIAWANVVVYVSSTVGLNAISRGVPAVAIDLGEFVDYDPAPDDCPLKWTVSRPDRLAKVFQEIQETGDEDYKLLQTQAVEFTGRYFNPVTDESLKQFSMMITSGTAS